MFEEEATRKVDSKHKLGKYLVGPNMQDDIYSHWYGIENQLLLF